MCLIFKGRMQEEKPMEGNKLMVKLYGHIRLAYGRSEMGYVHEMLVDYSQLLRK